MCQKIAKTNFTPFDKDDQLIIELWKQTPKSLHFYLFKRLIEWKKLNSFAANSIRDLNTYKLLTKFFASYLPENKNDF